MTELENIGKLAATASELLNAIRGGEIANMKAEHEQALQDFVTAHEAKTAEFTAQKAQALSDFATKKDDVFLGVAQKAAAVFDEIAAHLATSLDRQTHIRLTKNQVLLANPAGDFPADWSQGYVKRANKIETVKTGDLPETRSALAQEFLAAIDSNRQHFAGSFDIWELEVYPNKLDARIAESSLFMYQYAPLSQAVTVAAIVKHVSGVVPDGSYCTGLEANQPAKLCGTVIPADKRNHYLFCHPFILGGNLPAEQTTVIQIALPALV